MSKSVPDVSVCIVSFNTRDYLRRCLESIYANTKGISFEVIVVDNASSDDSAEMVRQKFSQAHLIQNTDNRWYSGANNQAIRQSSGRNLFILNPDAYIETNSIAKLFAWLDCHPKAGVIEPLQLSDVGEVAPTGSLLNQPLTDCIELTALSRWGSGLPGVRKFRLTEKSRFRTWQCQVVSGAALLARREAVLGVGGFDEQLKLYYTDVDLCRKMIAAGWGIWHVGECCVRHSLSVSTSRLTWKERNKIYAADAETYYRQIGKPVQGRLLARLMILNQWMIGR